MDNLRNLFSIKLLGDSGVAIIPEPEEGIVLTPGTQMAILVSMLDFFVGHVPEGEQNFLEEFLLDNFVEACNMRHETTERQITKLGDFE